MSNSITLRKHFVYDFVYYFHNFCLLFCQIKKYKKKIFTEKYGFIAVVSWAMPDLLSQWSIDIKVAYETCTYAYTTVW